MLDQSFAPQRQTTTDRIEQQLRADITAGRLPPGAKLGFEMLKKRYGVGVSPLREALQRLVSERLVIGEGHVGFRVAPLSIEELHDINNLRRKLAADALRDAIANGTPEWGGKLLAAAHELRCAPLPSDPDGPEVDYWEEKHRHFHAVLLSTCRSTWLLQFCRILDDQYLRYRRIVLRQYWSSAEVRKVIDREHQALVDAALNKDADTAVSLLCAHYDSSAEGVIKEYERLLRDSKS